MTSDSKLLVTVTFDTYIRGFYNRWAQRIDSGSIVHASLCSTVVAKLREMGASGKPLPYAVDLVDNFIDRADIQYKEWYEDDDEGWQDVLKRAWCYNGDYAVIDFEQLLEDT